MPPRLQRERERAVLPDYDGGKFLLLLETCPGLRERANRVKNCKSPLYTRKERREGEHDRELEE